MVYTIQNSPKATPQYIIQAGNIVPQRHCYTNPCSQPRSQKHCIECYTNAEFMGDSNQAKGTDPGSVLYITGYVITYADC